MLDYGWFCDIEDTATISVVEVHHSRKWNRYFVINSKISHKVFDRLPSQDHIIQYNEHTEYRLLAKLCNYAYTVRNAIENYYYQSTRIYYCVGCLGKTTFSDTPDCSLDSSFD
jgi:hypothetical protein